jgi:3'-phosphoadenosine 5'-phosphosulfate sulfotransferase (PAPS reductase)/FAD synthetase
MWTDEDVTGYIADHDVPVNPLIAQGYLSIGCMPCTVPSTDPDDPRSGRWASRDKTECGLHDVIASACGRSGVTPPDCTDGGPSSELQ